MLRYAVAAAMLFGDAMLPQSATAQQRVNAGPEWNALHAADESPAARFVVQPFPTPGDAKSTIGRTLFGSAAGAVATLAYFAVRNEDTYECNACFERGLVAGLTTMVGTGIGARTAGASTPRTVVASTTGTVVGGLLGLAVIEPLHAGWLAGGISYTVAQGLTAGLIAR